MLVYVNRNKETFNEFSPLYLIAISPNVTHITKNYLYVQENKIYV